MSYDVERYWFYKKKGRKLHLHQVRAGSRTVPDSNGRLASSGTEVIYPGESIEDGLRIEYTAFSKPFVVEDPESTVDSSLTEDTSPTESSHVNLNRMLSLACVDFLRAMIAERDGNLKTKEYFMRQFYKRLSDNASNLKHIFITTTNPVMSVR